MVTMSVITWSDVAGRVDGAGLAHVSTVGRDGNPHIAIVFAVREGNSFTFTMRTKSGKARNLYENPRAAFMWQGNSAETYVWGKVETLDEPKEKQRVWSEGFFPFDLASFYGSVDSPDWLVGRFLPERATIIVQSSGGLDRMTWTA